MITADKIYDKIQSLYFAHAKTSQDTEGWSHSYGKDLGIDSSETRSTFSVVATVNGSPANITMHHSHVRDRNGTSNEYSISVGQDAWCSFSDKGVLSGNFGDLINLAQAKGALMAITGEDIPVEFRLF